MTPTHDDNDSPQLSVLADFDGDIQEMLDARHPKTMPLLPMRNMVFFPAVVASVNITRKTSQTVIEQNAERGTNVALFVQKDAAVERPGLDDFYPEGIAAHILRSIDLPGGGTAAILQGITPLRLMGITRRAGTARAVVERIEEHLPAKGDKNFRALVDALRETVKKYFDLTEGSTNEGVAFTVRNIKNPVYLVNFLCANMPFALDDRYHLFAEHDISLRAARLMQLMQRECQYAELKKQIREQTHEDLNRQQREYFLHQQITNIRRELGEDENDDIARLEAAVAELQLPPKVAEAWERELAKLRTMPQQSPEYGVQLGYLQTITRLPWNEETADNLSVFNAQRILDRDHYGLERVKERILEHLAARRYRRTDRSPILCLYGPPGVGKTSLGRSIAEALGRRYVRISLGGLHDEAEIRGHRRTYVGAMPGRIIKGMMKAGSVNPLFVLDEIDKMSENNFNGDPYSALLEVLDPEQNAAFHDNYLDLDYDLSHVFFIATANSLQGIPRPLLDRMELIAVEGYLTEEKKQIARRHLIAKQQADFDFGSGRKLRLTPTAIETIIERYTRESGVRQLEKQINKLFRRVALAEATRPSILVPVTDEEGRPTKSKRYVPDPDAPASLLDHSLHPDDVERLLGKPLFTRDRYQGNRLAGVVTGLAWTAVGGEILFIETSLSRSRAPRLTLTGNLGDVMKESAMLALEYVRAHAAALGIDHRLFDHWSVHIHVPEGATPKDGPSAGITIATSIASALTQRRLRPHTAMTGEITLRGRVLPVGGIKEKILAAKRAGITDILLSVENRRDIDDIAPRYVDGLTFHYVETVSDVLRIALLPERVDDPLDLEAPVREEEEKKKNSETEKK